MLKIIRFVMGYVTFCLSGPFPERFINLCAHHGICIWNIKKEKNTTTCTTMASEYKTLRKLAKRSSMKIELKHKKGAPFIVKKYKKRKGLLVGAVCFFLIINFLSSFIWNVNINGNVTIAKNDILDSLKKLNIYSGIAKKNVDLSNIEATLMSKFNNFAWTSANIDGCNLELEFKEKISPPDLVARDEPCNIKASCDAYVTRVEVYSGVAEVHPGDSVAAGQLLVNGIFEDNFGQNSIHHADAKIFAITNKNFAEEIELCTKEHIYTGKKVHRKRAKIFNLDVPLTFCPIPKGNFDKNVKIKSIEFFKKPLPLTIYGEQWCAFKEARKTISQREASEIARKNIEEKEANLLKDVKILKKNIDEKIFNGKYILNVNYKCEENIAIKSPILLE